MKVNFKVEINRDGERVRAAFTGRLDAINAPEVQRAFDALTDEGERTIIADFTNVSYLSSAGIRVLLAIQKKLRTVSGEVIICNPPKIVADVLTMSGLNKLFTIILPGQELPDTESGTGKDEVKKGMRKEVFEGITFEYLQTSEGKGKLHSFGSGEKLAHSTYTKEDVISKKASDISFGVGIAASGEDYDEYSRLFGEAMVIDGNFFFYPTVKNPSVDFILKKHGDSKSKLHFLNGFSFSGNWQHIISFDDRKSFIEFSRLKKAIFNLVEGDLVGIVFLIESKGYWGISLKKPPVEINKMPEGDTIFGPNQFPDWFDYPVEAGESNHIIVGTGVLARDVNTIDKKIVSVFPENGCMHIHAGIFEKGHISRKVSDFEKELERLLNGHEPEAIYHILSKTRLKSGLMGVIELEI